MPLISHIKSTNEQDPESVKTRIHIRATLALLFSLGFIGGFATGLIDADVYKEVTMIVIIWYFTKRQSQED